MNALATPESFASNAAISRPTLRKWLRRYEHCGINGLKAVSQRPHTSPGTKVTPEQEKLTLEMRQTRKLGHRRLCNELKHAFMMFRFPLQRSTKSSGNTTSLICKKSAIIEKSSVVTADPFLVIESNWVFVKLQTGSISIQLLMTAHAI